MKNLRLIPEIHKQHAIIKANFAYDKELIAQGKSQKGAYWSQTLRSWCFKKEDFELNAFDQALKGKVFIDYSKLKKSTSPSTQNQYINAMKFCYEKVLKQPKRVFSIELPRKGKKLPEVLTEHEVLLMFK